MVYTGLAAQPSMQDSVEVSARRGTLHQREKGEAPGKDELTAWCMDAIQERIGQLERVVQRCSATSNLGETRMRIGERMSRHCAHIREAAALREVADAAKQEIAGYWQTVTITGPAQLPAVMINYDLLLAQQVYTAAMAQAIEDGVGSRGSYLVVSENGKLVHARLADDIRFVEDDGRHERANPGGIFRERRGSDSVEASSTDSADRTVV
ncbi:MAG: hypothetical protein ACLR23_07075 [Clostridia bacterium]